MDTFKIVGGEKLLCLIQSDYAFCGMSYKSSDQTTFWEKDESYKSQVNYSDRENEVPLELVEPLMISAVTSYADMALLNTLRKEAVPYCGVLLFSLSICSSPTR